MKRFLVLSLVLFLLVLPLGGCYCSQEELDDAYNDGLVDGRAEGYDIGYEAGLASTPQSINAAYRDGYNDGYTQGRLDAAKECKGEIPSYSGPFVGSVNSDVYHYPWCIWAQKILPQNEIWFDSVEEAQDADYRPCKVCCPP